MPIISDGNNQTGDQLSDEHTTMGDVVHSGSYSLSGSLTINSAYSFPTTDGTANQVLSTNGSGQISFASVAGVNPTHFIFGHADLNDNNKPVNWVNASSVSASTGIKTWFIVPYNGTINKAIVTVKGNGFDTSTDGQFTISLYKNQANYDSTAYTQTVNIDDFSEKVSNMNAGTVDCNQKVFSSINVSVSEGDLIQVKVNKTLGSEREALVTIVFT